MSEPTKKNSEGVSEFQIKPPSAGKWIIYIILLVVLNLGIYNFPGLWQLSIAMIILSIIVVPPLWGKVAKKIMRKNLINSFKKWNTNRKIAVGAKILNAFLGLSLDSEKKYYIEREGKKIDLNSIKEIFRNRIWDVISSCIGLTFLIALGLKYIIASYIPDMNIIMGISLVILNLTPFLVFWLVPIFWTMNDVDLRSIDSEKNISNIGTEMSGGIFSQFLGVAGILTGIGFFTDLGENYWSSRGVTSTVQIYVQSAIFLILFIACIAGTATFITVRYLSKYHHDIVNDCRKFFVEFLEAGETQVKLLEPSKMPSEPATKE